MKSLIVTVAILAAATSANAVITASGGTYIHFSNYSVPDVLTTPQSTGLQNAFLSSAPSEKFTATFLGKEARHVNQFWVNGGLVFNNLAAAPTTYGSFLAGGPLKFTFKDTYDTGSVPNGGNPSEYESYVVLGTKIGGIFKPYTAGGKYDVVLGFNDGSKFDADYDDLVVGLKAAPIPEPETYALMLAGLGVMGFLARRRRAD
jgi:hypothetical protein